MRVLLGLGSLLGAVFAVRVVSHFGHLANLASRHGDHWEHNHTFALIGLLGVPVLLVVACIFLFRRPTSSRLRRKYPEPAGPSPDTFTGDFHTHCDGTTHIGMSHD